jgi:hypothetical protein
MATDRVYAVHTTRPDEVGAVEIVFEDEYIARDYARSRSTDHRVLAVSVTSYILGELGTRHPFAWYRSGEEQPPRAARPGPYYPTDGVTGNGSRS